MKTTSKYTGALEALLDANEALMQAEIAHEEKKASIIGSSAAYASCTNDKQRGAVLLDEAATEIKAVRKAELAKMRAASKAAIAEVEWKAEKYDIIATVKVMA